MREEQMTSRDLKMAGPPQEFPWLNSQAGMSDRVLPPWTPIEVEEGESLRVSCWGRAYEFGKLPFLGQVVTAGKPILRRPIRLLARVDSRDAAWESAATEIKDRQPGSVTLSQRSAGAGLVLNATIRIEYDGMVRTDWTVTPVRPCRLNELVLEIPLRAEHARDVYLFPDGDTFFIGRDYPVGTLPPEGYRGSFSPVIWLGTEEIGLEWFAESDRNWYSDTPEESVEIVRGGEGVTLRLNLVKTPLDLAPDGQRTDGAKGAKMARPDRGPFRELSYCFGLQATPVKPVTEDCWDYRIAHLSQGWFNTSKELGTGARLRVDESTLDRMAELGVRTIAFGEQWTDIHGHVDTRYEEDLHWLVKQCHKRGIQLLLYFGYLMSDLAPEWPLYAGECLTHPIGKGAWIQGPNPPAPVQSSYLICYRSVWQDFVADGIDRAMEKYDIDGVYLDGTSNPFWGCRNLLHGCGYVKTPRDAVSSTYALFPIRDLLKRIYTIVKTRKPHGQVNVHQSGAMNISAMAWATSYWDGEHLYGAKKTFALERLPLDAFRAEFMGHQWGVPAEFLDYSLGSCTGCTWTQAHAITLLHDVPIRPYHSLERLEEAAALWRAMETFGRKAAEWLPYWNNQKYVEARPQGAYVSLYRHPQNGVLLVVSNLSSSELGIELRAHLSSLGISGQPKAHDALTGDSIPVDSGRMTLALPSLGWRLIWLKP